jgi:hypothetical protein
MFTLEEVKYLLEALYGYKLHGHKHWRDCVEYSKMNKQEHSIKFFQDLIREQEAHHERLTTELYALERRLIEEEEKKKHDYK